MNLGTKLLLNWGALATGLLTGIALYRYQLDHLGLAGLGTWVALSSAINYLSLMELGMSGAINKYVASYRALGQGEQEGRLLGTALCVYLALALAAVLVGALASGPLCRLLHVLPVYQRQARGALLVLSANTGAVLLFCLCRGTLLGRGRADLIGVATLLRHLAYAALVVPLLGRGGGLLALAAAGMAADLLSGAVLTRGAFVTTARGVDGTGVRLRAPDAALARQLVRFSMKLVLCYTGQQLLRSVTVPILQRMAGPQTTASYAAADKLVGLFYMLINHITLILIPLVAEMWARHGRGPQVLRATAQAGRLVLALGVPPLCALLVFCDRLLVAWLGPAMAGSALYLRIMGLAMLAELLCAGTDACAYATGLVRGYGILKMAAGIFQALLCVAGVRLGGAAGGALCYAATIVICDVLLTPACVCRAAGIPLVRYARQLFRGVPAMVAVCLGAAVLARLPGGGLAGAVLACALVTGLGWAYTLFRYLDAEERRLVLSRVQPLKP